MVQSKEPINRTWATLITLVGGECSHHALHHPCTINFASCAVSVQIYQPNDLKTCIHFPFHCPLLGNTESYQQVKFMLIFIFQDQQQATTNPLASELNHTLLCKCNSIFKEEFISIFEVQINLHLL